MTLITLPPGFAIQASPASDAEKVIERLRLSRGSVVAHLGSRDGSVLRYFAERGPRVFGVEPNADLAERAMANAIPTAVELFGDSSVRHLRKTYGRADLIILSHVLEQVEDVDDFVASIPLLLAFNGTLTAELPTQFALEPIEHLFHRHWLRVFDAEVVETIGDGVVRIWACHAADPRRTKSQLAALRGESALLKHSHEEIFR
jgi:SAM-dependent methyltransferase